MLYKPNVKIVEKIEDCDLVILCGPQDSGKTFLYELIDRNINFTRISDDVNLFQSLILGRYALMTGNKICIDRRSLTREERQLWIELARGLNLSIGMIVISNPFAFVYPEYFRPLVNELDLYDFWLKFDDSDINKEIIKDVYLNKRAQNE